MELTTFFHLQIIENPLKVSYHNQLEQAITDINPAINFFDFDNFSGDEIYTYARQLAKESNRILIFIDCKNNQAQAKIAQWLNFIVNLKGENILYWKGENVTIDLMKAAFEQKKKIYSTKELIEEIKSSI